MKHIKLFEQFANEKFVNEGKKWAFVEDGTEVTNPKEYSEKDLKDACDTISKKTYSTRGLPKYIKKENSIVMRIKGDIVSYYYEESNKNWIVNIEGDYSSDTYYMNLEEFTEQAVIYLNSF